jgi:predicted phosphoribosyltransferase
MSLSSRRDAGRKLAAALAEYKGQEPVVLALPRGGVPVAAEVAAELDAPMDLILVRKIGVPYQPSSPWARSSTVAIRLSCATKTSFR